MSSNKAYVPRERKKYDIQCTVCKVAPLKGRSRLVCATRDNPGYSVCNDCHADMCSSLERQGYRAICQACPDDKVRLVAYTRHQWLINGRPRQAFLCLECTLRVVCTTPAQQQQVRQICADPSIKSTAVPKVAVEIEEKVTTPERPVQSLSEYHASVVYAGDKQRKKDKHANHCEKSCCASIDDDVDRK